MTASPALTVALAYHDAWSSKQFERAAALLADPLAVEVPVNSYPTTASFAAAVEAFGSMTRQVRLLAAFGAGEEAMLLYDMDVDRLGMLRVAEHFTVREGRIARIRQIHDTAALRAAGFVDSPPSYQATVEYPVSPDVLFDAVAAPAGADGWWTTDGEAGAAVGDRVRLNWSGDDFIEFVVEASERPATLRWRCVAQHDLNLPQVDEWVGTTVEFAISPSPTGSSLQFEHRGLTPALDCYDICEGGWDFFLRRSLRQLLAVGQGLPYQPDRAISRS